MEKATSRPLRILQVVQKPQRRGAEIFALQLSQHLRCLGHGVTTAYLYPHHNANELPLVPGDRILGTSGQHWTERIPGVHPVILWNLLRMIRDVQPDVVQVNGGRTLKYGAAAASLQPHRRWVLIYRNIGHPRDWVRGWRHSVYAGVVMPHMDAVVGISRVTVQALKSLYRLSVPTACIPCAVDANAIVRTLDRSAIRKRTSTPDDAPVIVWVGSLTPEKRVDRLLRAAASILHTVPDLHIWIIGTGPLSHRLEADVRGSSLHTRIRFLGVQTHVADYMAAGDVLALTSDTEGMPATVLEAGLLGLPVVATRVGGLSECVQDGETGILIERDDEEGLAHALRDLLQQRDRRLHLGQAARAWVERHFMMSHVANQYAAFYEQLRTA